MSNTEEAITAAMDLDMAVNAAMAMLNRHGGLWGSDFEEVEGDLTVIIKAAMELAGDDAPESRGAATETLDRFSSRCPHDKL